MFYLTLFLYSFLILILLIVYIILMQIYDMYGGINFALTREKFRAFKCVPGPKEWPILGSIYIFWGTQAEMWTTLRNLPRLYQKRYKLRLLHKIAINVITPDDIEVIMSNPKQISKSVVYKLLEPWLQTGLLTSAGEKWRSRRKILIPSFHFNILKYFVKIFEANSKTVVKKINDEYLNKSVDVTDLITDFALHSLCETTMGCKFKSNNKEFRNYKNAIYRFGEIVAHRIFRPWIHPDLVFMFSKFGFNSFYYLRILKDFTSNIINERLRNWSVINTEMVSISGKKLYAMLDLLILQMKSGSNIDRNGIQEEVDTFMFRGHDTTSMGITFLTLLLANHQDVQDKIIQELHTVLGDDPKKFATYEELQSLTYLEMCIKEALRMYPPVPFISRTLDESLILKDGTEIPTGAICNIHIYDLHHDPNYWPEPNKFIPERFSPENILHRHPFAYIPFSAGVRNCIGQKFALLEMKSFFANLLMNYRLEPIDTPETIKLICDIVIRSKDPVRIKFVKHELF